MDPHKTTNEECHFQAKVSSRIIGKVKLDDTTLVKKKLKLDDTTIHEHKQEWW